MLEASPPDGEVNGRSLVLTTEEEFAKTLELRIKVSLSESNATILERAQNAILECPQLASSQLVLREANRTIIEIGANPVLLDVTLSAQLDRILLVKLPEGSAAQVLFQVLKGALDVPSLVPDVAKQRGGERRGEEEEEEMPGNGGIVDSLDGTKVRSNLDANYVLEVKRAMQREMEIELNTFAVPLERKAQDDERRLLLLQSLLLVKYKACGIPLCRLELAPGLAAFPLPKVDEPMLHFPTSTPTAGEIDFEFKRVLGSFLTTQSLSRQERKRQEVVARGEVCERNRFALVHSLATNPLAVDKDKDQVVKLGLGLDSSVVLFELPCLYLKRPAFLLVLPTCLVVEHRVWGFTFGQCLQINASHCRSVHKVPPTLSLVESLCVRMDDQTEHFFYLASILEDSSQQLDQVFELIWQVLRMNRTS
ncbi:hypothetical protein BASA81_002428 [Batrachochytrium salamandrivorans]|nr:hypothetical protein BASA81_002428 [Batrachochytrium salamandrivorans]